MSKSSKRRLAKSMLAAAAQTAASPQRATDILVGVPLLSFPVPSPLNSQLSTLNSPSPQRAIDTPVDVLLPCSSPLNSELSTFNSPSAPSSSELSSHKSPSASRPPTPPLCHSAILPLLPDPSSASSPNHSVTSPLSPSPPPLNSQLPTLSLPSDSAPSAPLPLDPSATPLQTELPHIQSRLRTAMREWCPSDPRFKPLLETYNSILQNITFERLASTLPMLDNKNWVETNKQIVRLHAVMERTHSRHSREQRERDTQVRREAREQQRIERQAQKQAEAIARNQRIQQRDEQRKEQRRQHEQAKTDRALEKHELAMRKLDIKERDITIRGKKSVSIPRQNPSTASLSPTDNQPDA